MYFDRWDIVEAYYLYFRDYHSGQSSIEYMRLSGILKYFKPSPFLDVDTLSENGLEIYNNLVNKGN